MTLHVKFDDNELYDLRRLWNRALNTLEPKDCPAWAQELDARIAARIKMLEEVFESDLILAQLEFGPVDPSTE